MQVLSWKPRALYFPRFATAEQCQSIIEMAKSHLRPSTLALRQGETDESTKGTRTRYLFVHNRVPILFREYYNFCNKLFFAVVLSGGIKPITGEKFSLRNKSFVFCYCTCMVSVLHTPTWLLFYS